jgi:8-oxo-dGTP diphosphatase
MRREILVVAAILMDRQGRVLLVGNDWGRKGLVRYTLPGGTVEPGETVPEALVREVREETGLRVKAIEHLAYVIQVEDRRKNERTLALAFRASYEGLLNPRDPDGHIVEARFFTLEEVAQKLCRPPPPPGAPHGLPSGRAGAVLRLPGVGPGGG